MTQNRQALRKEHQQIEDILSETQDEDSLPIPAAILADRLQQIENTLLLQPLDEPDVSPLVLHLHCS